MPANLDHARIIEALGDAHERRLQEALRRLEQRVVDVMSGAPTRAGDLFDLEWAISARAQIQSVLEQEYLAEVQSIIEGYDEAVQSAQSMLGQYGIFTEISPDAIRSLKTISFQGFQDIGARYLDVIATEVYQSALTGRSSAESVKTIRQAINGVYMESDSVEANKLVEIAQYGTGEAQEEAIRKLHTIYARDKAGNNLRRYASQMVHDSLMQFDAGIVVNTSKEAGVSKFKYFGTRILDTRDFCVRHLNKIYTEDEIREIWETQDWVGKAPGDPFIVRGGYNCRHHWQPVVDEDEDRPEVVIPPPSPPAKRVALDESAFLPGTDRESIERILGDMNDDDVAAIAALPKPSRIETKGNEGSYAAYQTTKIPHGYLIGNPAQDNGRTIRHEYGHHIDFMLGKNNLAFSQQNQGFIDAYEADRKALGLRTVSNRGSFLQSWKEANYDRSEYTKGRRTYISNTPKHDAVSGSSDILDAMTGGIAHSNFYMFGHGKSYYKRNGAKYKETFANLFEMRGSKNYDKVIELFPNLTREMDKIIKSIGAGT